MPKTSVRKNQRVPCLVPAKAEGPKGTLRGTCKSLSVAGMFFAGPQLPVGQVVELSVDLPQGTIRATGEVRYQVAEPKEGVGMGIRFTRLGAEDLQRLEKFVQEG